MIASNTNANTAAYGWELTVKSKSAIALIVSDSGVFTFNQSDAWRFCRARVKIPKRLIAATAVQYAAIRYGEMYLRVNREAL